MFVILCKLICCQDLSETGKSGHTGNHAKARFNSAQPKKSEVDEAAAKSGTFYSEQFPYQKCIVVKELERARGEILIFTA